MEFSNKIFGNDHTHDRRKVTVKIENKNDTFFETRMDGLMTIFEEKMILNNEK